MRYIERVVSSIPIRWFLAGFAAVGALTLSGSNIPAAPITLSTLPKVFTEDFADGAADRWEPSDPHAWRMEKSESGPVYSQFQPSKIKTPVRSPYNRSLIRGLSVGSFVFDVQLQSTARDYPHRDVCLFFGYQDPAHMYYVHLGKKADDHANQIFIVNGKPRTKISTQSTDGTNWDDRWHHVRVTRDVESGEINTYFDDLQNPVMRAVDKTFRTGRLGIGTFDDTARFKSVVVLADKETPSAAGLNLPPDGFTALFNGKDLTGWKGLVKDPKNRAQMTKEELAEAQEKADRNMHEHWRAADGMIIFDGSRKGANLCTARDYGDFELRADWKIGKGGDSGIYLRGSPQVQMWDPDDPAQLKNGADKGSGALWNNAHHERFPLVRADNPIGQWNTFRIRMVGDKVTVWLNDKLVTDHVVMENYWERDKPIYPTGAIELQNHNHELFFRNLFVKELSGDEKKP